MIEFKDLQALSGYKQSSKVIAFLREHRIRYIIGGDGKPLTTSDFLSEDLDGEKQTSTILFER